MRVLYFYRNDNVHDRRFLEALGGMPVEVAALALEKVPAGRDEWYMASNIKRFTWKLGGQRYSCLYEPILLQDLNRVARTVKPDVIHAGPLDLCAYFAARSINKPLVSMSWGFDLLVNAKRSMRSRRRIQYALDRSSILLDDCKTISEAAENFGYPRDRIITFPWGVDLKNFHPKSGIGLRRSLGWEKSIVFISMRTMEKQYGVDVVVKAFIQAATKEKSLVLLLLGNGSQKSGLIRDIESAGLIGRVKFMGSVSETEVSDFINASDVYVSASHSDGSSVSLLQAMACGKPALISDIPGNREWVVQGHNGWLFEDGNASALEHLMLLAAKERGLRNELGRTARKTVMKRGDWGKNHQKILEAYRRACEIDNRSS